MEQECNKYSEESLSKLSMKNAIAWKPIPKQKIDFILRSTIYTQYNIYAVQYIRSTIYTQYNIYAVQYIRLLNLNK